MTITGHSAFPLRPLASLPPVINPLPLTLFQATAFLRNNVDGLLAENQNVFIAALSADLNMSECKRVGMNAFLSKPLTRLALSNAVSAYLSSEPSCG